MEHYTHPRVPIFLPTLCLSLSLLLAACTNAVSPISGGSPLGASTAFLHALLSGDAQAAYAQLQPVDQSPKSMDTLRNTVAALAPCVQSNAQTDYQTGLQAFGYVEVEAVFNPPCVRLRLMTHQYLPSDIGRVCVVQTIQINGRWRPALMGSRSFFCGKSDSGY